MPSPQSLSGSSQLIGSVFARERMPALVEVPRILRVALSSAAHCLSLKRPRELY